MRIFAYIFITLFTVSSVWGQNVTQNEAEVARLLANTWQMSSMTMNGQQMAQKEGVKDMGFTFKTDNTYEFIENGKVTAVGLWKLIPDRKWVALASQQTVSLLITSISKDEFIAIHPSQVEAPKDGLRMEVHFKVKQ